MAPDARIRREDHLGFDASFVPRAWLKLYSTPFLTEPLCTTEANARQLVQESGYKTIYCKDIPDERIWAVQGSHRLHDGICSAKSS